MQLMICKNLLFRYRVIVVVLVVRLTLILPTALHGQLDFPELLPHNVVVVRWSSQGDFYATGHVDGSIRVYDRVGLRLTIAKAHSDWINGISFNPDNSRLVTAGSDKDVRIWNTTTGALVGEILDISYSIHATNWSPDGVTIVTMGLGDDRIISADVATDTYSISQNVNIGSSQIIAYKPDNTMIAASNDLRDLLLLDPHDISVVRILDVNPGVDLFEPPNETTTGVAWHPVDNIVANGKLNGWIHIWNLASASDNIPLLSLQANEGATDDALIPFDHRVLSITFNGDGSRISSVSSDGTIRTWDAETGVLLSDENLGEAILSSAFSPDGSELIYNPYSTEDMPPTRVVFPILTTSRTVEATADTITSLAWNATGTQLAIAGVFVGQPGVQIQDQTGQVDQFLPTGARPLAVSWSPDDSRLAATFYPEHFANTYIWDVETGALLNSFEEIGAKEDFFVHWNPVIGNDLIATTESGIVNIRDGQTMEVLRQIEVPGIIPNILTLAWSVDGTQVFTLSGDGIVRAWDATSLELLREVTVDGATSLSVSPGGDQLAVTSWYDTVSILDPFTFAAQQNLQVESSVGSQLMAARWHPDGTQITTSSFNDITVWDLQSGTIVNVFPHPNRNTSVQLMALDYSLDGRLTFVSEGNTIIIHPNTDT